MKNDKQKMNASMAAYTIVGEKILQLLHAYKLQKALEKNLKCH